MNEEIFAKAREVKSPEELIELAKANGREMTAEEAEAILKNLSQGGEISDDELENAVGGCGGGGNKASEPIPWLDCNPTQYNCKASPITLMNSAYGIYGWSYWACKECGNAVQQGSNACCEHVKNLPQLNCTNCKWSKANSPD